VNGNFSPDPVTTTQCPGGDWEATPRQFAPPPTGKIGWPWTEESPRLPEAMADGSPWPRVSIITPSYNQGQFIEETIRSVLLQGYPSLEYIIVDGGSTDGSVDTIRRYAHWLAYWVSEPDAGQADAIRKGLGHATGEIAAYLNSDDVYLPGAIATAVVVFHADQEVALVHGGSLLVDPADRVIGHHPAWKGEFLESFINLSNPISQPSAFIRESALSAVGGIDPTFQMIMDYDLWARIGLHGMKIRHIDADLSMFRLHPDSKTTQSMVAFAEERRKMVAKYLTDPELAPQVLRYRRRLEATADLHLSNAYWLVGQKRPAYERYRLAMRAFPGLILSRRGFGLLLRFLLRRRSFRARLAEMVEM
jgi:glycosyltransferase involved in cell wall biosynthesis